MWLPQSAVNPKPCGSPCHSPPARVLSPLVFPAKSLQLPKPRGKKKHSKTTWSSPIHSAKAACFSPFFPKTSWSSLFSFRTTWSSLSLWLPHLGLNPSAHLPLQPHFRLLLQPVTPASIPVFFQLYWAVIVSPGRCGPLHGMEPIISTLSRRLCNQGELLPSYILGGICSHPPGSNVPTVI